MVAIYVEEEQPSGFYLVQCTMGYVTSPPRLETTFEHHYSTGSCACGSIKDALVRIAHWYIFPGVSGIKYEGCALSRH